jgi:putative transposase
MARYAVLRPHLEDGTTLAEAARQASVPVRTAQRWLASYRALGLAGLVRRPRSDRGSRSLPETLVTFIEGMALRTPTPSAATIHRTVTDLASEQHWPVPSYATVYGIVAGLDPGMVTLAREGTKRYEETYDLIYRRQAARSNEMWQADHTELDIWIVDLRRVNPPAPG